MEMKVLKYKALISLVILIAIITFSCAKYDNYSKCGNEPEAALEGLYKAYADQNYTKSWDYLAKVDAEYSRQLNAKQSKEKYDDGFDINSYLAKNSTWTVKDKKFNKDGTALLTLDYTMPNVGKVYGEAIAASMFDILNCKNEVCLSENEEKLNESTNIKDDDEIEFITEEMETEFICEGSSWKVKYDLELNNQIDDEIVDAMRLYSKEGKKDEALRRLNEIPNKYEINKYQKEEIKFILGSINGIYKEIY